MSPSRPHTVGGVVEPPLQDEDDDICPVCESDCTCGNRQGLDAPSATNPPILPPPPLPASSTRLPLKIKLTLPPHLKIRQDPVSTAVDNFAPLPESHSSSPVSLSESHASHTGSLPSSQPKRRGRPPKAVVAAREATRLSSQVVVLPQPN